MTSDVSKMDCLKKIITILSKNNFKLIIFSDYRNIFSTIEKMLKTFNLKSSQLDGGSINSINQTTSDYKYGNLSILMVDSSLYGCGMNFENTTDIILLHKCNKAQQIIGRAQRPGRTCTLRVHNLLYPNETIGQNVKLVNNSIGSITNYDINTKRFNVNGSFYLKQNILMI